MPDSHPMPPDAAGSRGRVYTTPEHPATPALRELLRQQITSSGPLDFADFMATALYHPQLGYYGQTPGQVGRQGDFFTSVSVGPLFGELLARRFLQWWHTAGNPTRWRIIECGAHDGTLANDVLTAIRQLAPSAFATLEYAIPEPLPKLLAAQQQVLTRFTGRVRHANHPAELADFPLPGIAFANELLDALPFHVVEWHDDGWHACRVSCGPDDNLCWDVSLTNISDPALVAALAPLGPGYPSGYRTEVRTNHAAFLAPLLDALSSGLLLFIDYGFARPDYYHPSRLQGTLRTFSRHRAAADPLVDPGAIDITAHVDFTAVAGTATALGCRPLVYCSQGSWLTGVAREWLLEMEGRPDAKLLRQFQSLTHPAHLGRAFQVLELAHRDPAAPSMPPSDRHRLALDD